MKRNIIFIVLLLFIISLQVVGKEKKEKVSKPVPVKTLIKNARAAIKNNSNQDKEEKNIANAMGREDLTNEDKVEMLYTLAQLNKSMHEVENMKAYLKQPYDTVRFFNTMLMACKYAVMCDSLDSEPDDKGKVKLQYRSKNRDLLIRYRPNLYSGGRFFLRKNNYKSSLPFLVAYYDMMDLPMMNYDMKLTTDTLLDRVALYAVVASYDSNQPRTTLKYIDRAIATGHKTMKPLLQEYKVRSNFLIGDTLGYYKELKVGCRDFPRHDYFFLQLTEEYDSLAQYDDCIALADTMIARVGRRPIYWYAKSVMNVRKNNWEEAARASDSVLVMQPDHIDALYNKGISHLNMTMEFASTACYDFTRPECIRDREKIMQGYRDAQKPFERLRALLPDDKEKWGSPLYRIYLNLNKGKEFAEIEKLLNE